MGKLKKLAAALVLCVALLPAVKVKAYTPYEGDKVTGLTQTDATETSITISWSPTNGAASYQVKTTFMKEDIYEQVTGTTYTFACPKNTSCNVEVFPINADGGQGFYSQDQISVQSLPLKVENVHEVNSAEEPNKVFLQWDYKELEDQKYAYLPDGYELTCYNYKNKKVQKLDSKTNLTKLSKLKKNAVYKIEIKPFIKVKNDKAKKYGKAVTFYYVPTPTLTVDNAKITQTSVPMKWKKITGATKYEIWVSNSQDKGYKKVTSVKGTTTAYNFKKFKGKKINTYTKNYYIQMVTVAKIGKKTVKSEKKLLGYITH